MATLKFWNIGKANEEITRLEAEVIKAQAEAKTSADNLSEIETAAELAQSELTQAKADLVIAKASLTSANGAHDVTKGELAGVKAELKTANEKLANPTEQISKAAAVKAAEITSAQGQPPVKVAPAGDPTGGSQTNELKGFAKVQAAIKAQLNPTPKS